VSRHDVRTAVRPATDPGRHSIIVACLACPQNGDRKHVEHFGDGKLRPRWRLPRGKPLLKRRKALPRKRLRPSPVATAIGGHIA